MSIYVLQKMIRDVNRDPAVREAYFADKASLLARYDLSDEERSAVAAFNLHKLYTLGVHGLLLRPFSILHQVPEPTYLAAIRGEAT